jgi:hypothetical protein
MFRTLELRNQRQILKNIRVNLIEVNPIKVNPIKVNPKNNKNSKKSYVIPGNPKTLKNIKEP